MLSLGLLLIGLGSTPAQQIVPLIDRFTHAWRYDDSGRDRGTTWRTNSFNDTTWPAGQGLFGVETGVPFPYVSAGFRAMDVPLVLLPPGSNTTTITYYFRAHFTVTHPTLSGIVLRSTNFLDDGAVIYLNSVEVARFRVPTNQTFQTLTPNSVTEGVADVTNLSSTPLRLGDNVLAVEVHQSSTQNADVAFAMSLTAIIPEPLSFTRVPGARTNVVGTSTTFDVEVSGGPVNYQWLRDGVPIPGARTNAYTIPQVQFPHAGQYSVLITNAVSTAVSAEAQLSVVPDTFGPKLLSAVVNETGATNRILVTFSEQLTAATATNRDNYRLTRSSTGAEVEITNLVYRAGPEPQVLLNLGGPGWVIGEEYVLTASGLRDATASNVIAPNSQIGVAWPQTALVVRADHPWDFHTAAVFDPDVFNTPWWTRNYSPGSWWAQGTGVFCGGPVQISPCVGRPQTEVGFQYEPSLFRTTFQAPNPIPPNARLRISCSVDDGVVLYLNGGEIFRANVPDGPVHAGTLAASAVGSFSTICSTQIVAATHLLPGDNVLAAAVCQSNPAEGDTVFGLQFEILSERISSIPAAPSPVLQIEAVDANAVKLSWLGNGFALETSDTLSDTNSAPTGPWTEVTDMTNPYTTEPSTTRRFFRLRK